MSTPLNTDSWEVLLAEHTDRAFAGYVTQGLREGFRICFRWDAPLASAMCNIHSTRLRPAAISGYIADELSKGRMLGPLPPTWRPRLHVNRFGLIPKGHNTGKYRLITDLSFPQGRSVNDGITPALTSLSYITVDGVVQVAQHLGKGSLLAVFSPGHLSVAGRYPFIILSVAAAILLLRLKSCCACANAILV